MGWLRSKEELEVKSLGLRLESAPDALEELVSEKAAKLEAATETLAEGMVLGEGLRMRTLMGGGGGGGKQEREEGRN